MSVYSNEANVTLSSADTHPDGTLSLEDSHHHDNSQSGRGLSAGILIRADLDIKLLQHEPKTSSMSLASLKFKP